MDLKALLGDKNYGETLKNIYREVSLAVIAQVQLTDDRNKRVMGARFDMTGKQLHQYLDRADNVRRKCATVRQIKYKPIFAKALRLIDHYQKTDNQEKVDDIRRGLLSIGVIYNTYVIIEELANECFDEVYNQTEVMSVQGFNPPDEDDGSPQRIAIDSRRVRSNERKKFANRESAEALITGSEDDETPFETALKEAAAEAFGDDDEEAVDAELIDEEEVSTA